MTNSQVFGIPQVEDGELSIYMAAPGETADGDKFTGFYQVYLPDHVLDHWDVEDPKEDLEIMWQGSEERFSVEQTEGGVYIEIHPVEFSDGTMEVRSLNYSPSRFPFDLLPIGITKMAVVAVVCILFVVALLWFSLFRN
ncbi:MAG: hypothetical protein ACLFUR_05465 [Candidatus Hadarchaeia archaeon]